MHERYEQELKVLAKLFHNQNVVTGGYNLAFQDGHFVVNVNDEIERLEGGYRFWTKIYHVDGRIERIAVFDQFGKDQFRYPYPTQQEVDNEIYKDFYNLWAETAETEDERSNRRALVAAHWIAMDLSDLSGGYEGD